MKRATITLGLGVVLALMGCDRNKIPQVRLVKVQHSPRGCHLTLNGTRVPDDVLAAEGKLERGKQAVRSIREGEPDSCVGAIMRLQRAGVNVREFPSIDLRS